MGRAVKSDHPVHCGNCHEEIEHCDSEGQWMHSSTRREACACGPHCTEPHTATPETPDGWYSRAKGGSKR